MAAGDSRTAESDEALLCRIAAGDAEAFGDFYGRHEALLFGLALRILQDSADAEDVVQEAAIVLWERAALYDPGLGRPVSWAVTLVRNRAIDRLRSLRRRGVLIEKAREDAEAQSGIAEGLEGWGDSAAAIRRALQALPPDQRRAIELAFFSGLSQSEIAEELRQPLGTIKARIRRGMLAMRDALEGAL